MFSFAWYQNNVMLPIFPTVLLSQKLFSQKRLISEVTKLLKYLDFKLHLNSKISVLHRFCSWASSSKCAQTGGRLKELGFKPAARRRQPPAISRHGGAHCALAQPAAGSPCVAFQTGLCSESRVACTHAAVF